MLRTLATTRTVFTSLAALLVAGSTADRVHADVLTFNFNPLAHNAGNTAIASYMNQVIAPSVPGGSVKVSGARVETNYTGDDHVVGPVIGGQVRPVTLGTSDQGVLHPAHVFDSFLVNHGSTSITMQFSFPVYAVSFDYQIFPDAHVPDGTKTNPGDPDWPDFSFRADGQLIFRTLGIMPGQQGTFSFAPLDGTSSVELAPQFLGMSGTILFPDGVTLLQFVDWPRMIGIDNLQVSTAPPGIVQEPPTSVPEPASVIVFSLALTSLVVGSRMRRRSGT